MSNFQFLVPITELQKIKTVSDQLAHLLTLDRSKNIWLKKHLNWIATPIESSDHFDEEDLEGLLKLTHGEENQEIFAVALENLENFPSILKVPPTIEGFEEFNRYCGHFWFALYSSQLDWVIVCTKRDFFIIAGEKNTVNDFLKQKFSGINDAFLNFHNFLMDDYISVQTRQRLMYLYKQLLSKYPVAKPDEFISLTL